MKITLAGYNVDADVLKDLTEQGERREDVTPETLAASYARISRDPRAIDEIRKDARLEVERTRRSNQTIIFKMGHHSVAEHAIFNFDIIGVSRYVMEEIEHFRLCSYTEKSQRYITLEDDFVIPAELRGTAYESEFVATIRRQNKMYHVLYEKLKKYVFAKYKELAQNPKKHNLLEGWAKEDARYITALATESQVGFTTNARNLELMLRRFASHPLDEVQAVGKKIYDLVKEIAPSIILFNAANELDEKTYPELQQFCGQLFEQQNETSPVDGTKPVTLVHWDRNGDDIVLASLAHTVTNKSFNECMDMVAKMDFEAKKELFKRACQYMQLYDSLPREFEYASLTYDVVLSAACFGQIKRHRMATITAQGYDPQLDLTIPQSIKEVGLEKEFRCVAEQSNELYYQLLSAAPAAAPYILTNAHQRRILVRTNVRELYHMSRLREDAHAQWDICEKTQLMTHEARIEMPLAFLLVGGKDRYADIYKSVFGKIPKIAQVKLPDARKIKV